MIWRILAGIILAAIALPSYLAWGQGSALSQLPVGGPIQGSDLFYDVQQAGFGGVQVSANQLLTFISNSLNNIGVVITNTPLPVTVQNGQAVLVTGTVNTVGGGGSSAVTTNVTVNNFPASQVVTTSTVAVLVTGTVITSGGSSSVTTNVTVNNFPASQTVTWTTNAPVTVSNPQTLVTVQNFPASQVVTWTTNAPVTVSNPQTLVTVQNFPASPQNVTIPSPQNVTIPSPQNVTIPSPQNVTLTPTPINVTIATAASPQNVTLTPTPINVTISSAASPQNVTIAATPLNVTIAATPLNVTLTPTPINVVLTTASNISNFTTADPCGQAVKIATDINSGASATVQVLASSVAGKKVYVCAFYLGVAVNEQVNLVEGGSPQCSGTKVGIWGSATATQGMLVNAGTSIQFGNGTGTVGQSAVASNQVCVTVSTAGVFGGSMTYVQQ